MKKITQLFNKLSSLPSNSINSQIVHLLIQEIKATPALTKDHIAQIEQIFNSKLLPAKILSKIRFDLDIVSKTLPILILPIKKEPLLNKQKNPIKNLQRKTIKKEAVKTKEARTVSTKNTKSSIFTADFYHREYQRQISEDKKNMVTSQTLTLNKNASIAASPIDSKAYSFKYCESLYKKRKPAETWDMTDQVNVKAFMRIAQEKDSRLTSYEQEVLTDYLNDEYNKYIKLQHLALSIPSTVVNQQARKLYKITKPHKLKKGEHKLRDPYAFDYYLYVK